MRGAVVGFWAGAVVAALLFAASGGTAVEIRVTGTEGGRAQLEQNVDQGSIAGLLGPSAPAIGVLHIRKHSWGLLTTYSATLAAPGAQAAGVSDVRMLWTVPGAVTETNAARREGRTLVWTGLPGTEPAWAESRAVNWPAVILAATAAALTLWTIRSPR